MGPENWQNICQITAAIGIIMTGLGGYGSWHFGKQTDKHKASENDGVPMPKVNIENSQLEKSPVIVDSPGSHVDNSTTYNILTEQDPQEAFERVTGTRDYMGLYVDGAKLGAVINPILSEDVGTFTIEQINFTKPWSGPVRFPQMEFRSYLLQIEQVQSFAAMTVPSMTASATGVRGRILKKSGPK